MSYCTSAYSSLVVIKTCAVESMSPQPPPPPTHWTFLMVWERPLTKEELYYQVVVFDRYGGEESTAQKGLLRPEKSGNLRRSQRLATRHACAEESLRRMVVGTGRLYPTQTGDNSRDDASSSEVDFSGCRPISSTCRI